MGERTAHVRMPGVTRDPCQLLQAYHEDIAAI